MTNPSLIEVAQCKTWTFEASVACNAGQLVYIETGKVRPTTAASQHVFGVALNNASASRPCAVIMEGIVKIAMTGGGDLSAGGLVGPSVDGKGVPKTETGAGEDRYKVGYALTPTLRNARATIKLIW